MEYADKKTEQTLVQNPNKNEEIQENEKEKEV